MRSRSTAALPFVLSLLPGWLSAQPPIRHVERTSLESLVLHASAYDPGRERVVLFGQGQTWEWDGGAWRRRDAQNVPGSRHMHAMAYDEASRGVLLFGGTSSPGRVFGSLSSTFSLAETWQWDGVGWTQLLPVHAPSPRFGAAVASDAARQRVVLFGGAIGLASQGYVLPAGDTWEWDGSDWLQRSPQQSPPARDFAAMAYDAARQLTVMFGGYDASGFFGSPAVVHDCWEWDGSDWQQASTAGLPPAIVAPQMVFDTARQRVVLFGNDWAAWPSSFAAWEWNGAMWMPVPAWTPLGTAFHAAVAHDAARGETILCGGTPDPCNDALANCSNQGVPFAQMRTRALGATGTTVREVGVTGGGARYCAFDSVRGAVVWLAADGSGGGCTQTPTMPATSTREWHGREWLDRGAAPSAAPLAFDSANAVTVMSSGQDTWHWDGVSWQQQQPAVHPTFRMEHALAFDAARARTVLFGGFYYTGFPIPPVQLDETWEYDSVTWQQRTPANNPAARRGHGMAYDPIRGRTVLFGGLSAAGVWLDETWEWDGTDWQQVGVWLAPPAGNGQAICWDPSRQMVVYYTSGQLWAYYGTHWAPIQTAQPLPPMDGALVFDENRQALLVAGSVTRLIGDVVEPMSQPAGLGCPGSAGVPQLDADLLRIGDDDVRFTADHTIAGAPVVFGLSAQQQSVAIGGGCVVYLATPLALFVDVANPYGHAEIVLPVPFDLALRGLDVWSQAAALDPLGAASGLALTPALRSRIGD